MISTIMKRIERVGHGGGDGGDGSRRGSGGGASRRISAGSGFVVGGLIRNLSTSGKLAVLSSLHCLFF